MLERLKEFICDFINIDPSSITENTNIRTDVALDSISLLNLAVAVENEFGIEVTDEDVLHIETVGDFLRLVEEQKKN